MGYKQERNKAAAMDFYTTMVNHKDPQTAMDKYGASYYRQHNPHVEDKKEGFIKHFKALAISSPHEDFYPRVIAEDDLVLMHVWHHELPAHFPYEKTLENYKRYGLMSFDIFRFSEEGRIMEHWDSMQWSPFPASFNEIGLVEVEPWWPEGTYSRLEEPLCTSPMMEGETEIRDLDKTQQNKEIARQFVQDILMDKRFGEISGRQHDAPCLLYARRQERLSRGHPHHEADAGHRLYRAAPCSCRRQLCRHSVADQLSWARNIRCGSVPSGRRQDRRGLGMPV